MRGDKALPPALPFTSLPKPRFQWLIPGSNSDPAGWGCEAPSPHTSHTAQGLPGVGIWRKGTRKGSTSPLFSAQVIRGLPEMRVPSLPDLGSSELPQHAEEPPGRLISSPALLKLGLFFHGCHFHLSQH